MKRAALWMSIGLCIQVQAALGMELEDIRWQWLNANYEKVIDELLKYRDSDFGKTVEVDYMPAPSSMN